MERIALTLAMCLFTLAAQAELIYKWVGSDGTTQYTSTPPQDRPYETIKKAPAPRSYDPSVMENSRRQLQEAREQAEEQKARADLEAKDKEVADKKAKNCTFAKQNLEKLEAHTGVLRQDVNTGVVVRLTEEERQAQIEKMRRDVDYFCEGDSIAVTNR